MSRLSAKPLHLPPAPKGFGHIKRFWDPTHQVITAKILPGECYVSGGSEMISTVLGSCISACVRDPIARVGGMNHFMLPLQSGATGISRTAAMDPALCYGNWAMEYLVNEILKLGGRKDRLEIKVFGGGRVLSGMTNIDVGKQNIAFIMQYLASEGLTIKSQDVGDIYPRKVLYFPATGSVKMKKMKTGRTQEISQREKNYLESMAKPASSDVELF
ncbi:MAG TPA: chemoreceptor glutamine deamidase CheD [Marinagarivorans sp.]